VTRSWRCCSRELGFTVLSRDATAGRAGVAGLAEVPVTVDWFAKRHQVPVDRSGRARLLAEAIDGDDPVGVMLHHAVTGTEDLADLGGLLALVTTHPAATLHHLHTLACDGDQRRFRARSAETGLPLGNSEPGR
jgi:hypothetical protein